MKKIFSLSLLVAALLLQPAANAPAAQSSLQKPVVLTPGQDSETRFYLPEAFNRLTFSPVALFPVLTLGAAGSLSAELAVDPEEELDLEFTDDIKGMLLGIAFTTAHPFSIKAGKHIELPVEATFGFALIGAVITEISTNKRFDEDIPCSITFSLTEQEEQAEDRSKP
jgi:hypothetical protein